MGPGKPSGTGSDPQWGMIAQMGAQDASLNAMKNAAQQRQVRAEQSQLSDDTLNLVKMFGARVASSGAGGIAPPFTAPGGGFATPFLTPSGGMVGARS